MKRVFLTTALVALMALTGAATASAGPLTWYTLPVLGVGVAYTGNVVVTTTSGIITIPYAEPGDPPDTGVSMSVFHVANPSDLATVATGSAAYVTQGIAFNVNSYFYKISDPSTHVGEFTEINPWDLFGVGDDPFWMMWGHRDDGTTDLLGVGFWVYREEWTQEGNDTISMETPFAVVADTNPVPEPATLSLLGLGLAGVARAARKRKK